MEMEECIASATHNTLVPLRPSTHHLLLSLHELENILKRVEQSQSNSIQGALGPIWKMLTATELLNHLDKDVRVYVASCFNQIMRITAPCIPWDNKQMKEILRVIVSTFDNISDTSSHCYDKLVSILESMAGTRSCLLMVDLECYALIVDMFKYFLGNLRENHPDEVFSSMGLIMILVLEKIKEVPVELLSTLLDSVRNGNQDIFPVARKLGKKVIENCALKLAPYIHRSLQHMGFPLCDYSKIVAHICAQQLPITENDEPPNSQDDICLIVPSNNELSHKASMPGQTGYVNCRHVTSTMSIGSEVDKENRSRKHNSYVLGQAAQSRVKRSKDSTEDVCGSPSLVQSARIGNIVSLQAEGIGSSSTGEEYRLPGVAEKRSCENSKNSMNLPQVFDCSRMENAHSNSDFMEVSHHNTVCSPSPLKSATIVDISSPLANDAKTFEEIRENEMSSAALLCTPEILSNGTFPGKIICQDGTPFPGDILEGDGVTNTMGRRQPKETSINADEGITMDKNSVDKLSTTKQSHVRGKCSHGKNVGGEYYDKKVVCGLQSITGGSILPSRTPRARLKRSHYRQIEKTDLDLLKGINFGAKLIGLKIQVRRTGDHQLQKGVVQSYDPLMRKHKILYADGDEEMLHFRRQYWRFVHDANAVAGGVFSYFPGPDTSVKRKRKQANVLSNSLAKEMASNFTLHRQEETSTEKLKFGVTNSSDVSSNIAGDGSGQGNKSSKDISNLSDL